MRPGGPTLASALPDRRRALPARRPRRHAQRMRLPWRRGRGRRLPGRHGEAQGGDPLRCAPRNRRGPGIRGAESPLRVHSRCGRGPLGRARGRLPGADADSLAGARRRRALPGERLRAEAARASCDIHQAGARRRRDGQEGRQDRGLGVSGAAAGAKGVRSGGSLDGTRGGRRGPR